MKKLLWIAGGLFLALLVALVSIPLFVNVDRYRPEILAEANKRINGTLELGKLNLSLWGAVKIHAESIKLHVRGFPDALVDTDQFHLEIPFSSIFAGKPQVIAVLRAPRINLVKNAEGRTNILELMNKADVSVSGASREAVAQGSPVARAQEKPAATALAQGSPRANTQTTGSAATAQATGSATKTLGNPPAAPAAMVPDPVEESPLTSVAAAEATESSEPTKVPALVAGATLGLQITEGQVNYVDILAKSEYRVNGLELEAQNLGLGSHMTFALKAPLDGKTPTLTFAGPVQASGEFIPVLVGTQVKSVKGSLDVDASALMVEMPGKFLKPSGMTLTAKARIDGDENETLVRQLDAQFSDYKIYAKGRVTTTPVTAKFDVTASSLKLEQLSKVVPMLGEYDLRGILSLSALIEMAARPAGAAALKASGDLKVSEGSFFLKDKLKVPLQFVVQAGFTENSLNVARAALSGPDTELQLNGTIKNFLAPQFALSLNGKSFNVDKILVLPAAPTKQASFSLVTAAYAADAPKADVNPMLALAANPVVAKAAGMFSGQLARLVAYGSSFEQVKVMASLADLQLKLQEVSLRTYGGTVKTNGEFDLKSQGLRYSLRGNVAGISGKDAFKTYFPKYQNTFEGDLNAEWNVTGSAYPAASRLRNLNGSAKLLAKDGALKSVDFQESINSTMAKVPFLKDKKPLSVDDGFKTMTANLSFNAGVVTANPIEVQPRNAGKGFVVKGSSVIQENLEQESFFDIFDPNGRLPKEIQKPGKPALALRLYGPLTAPKTDYEYTVKRLASNAGANAAKDLASKALDKFIGGQTQEGDKSNALKDAAEKLKKKFKLF